jgi:hypothetical protein
MEWITPPRPVEPPVFLTIILRKAIKTAGSIVY